MPSCSAGNPAWVEDTICCTFHNVHAVSTITHLLVKPTAAQRGLTTGTSAFSITTIPSHMGWGRTGVNRTLLTSLASRCLLLLGAPRAVKHTYKDADWKKTVHYWKLPYWRYEVGSTEGSSITSKELATTFTKCCTFLFDSSFFFMTFICTLSRWSYWGFDLSHPTEILTQFFLEEHT